MNIAAIKQSEHQFIDVDIVFLESGGDHLAATFSPELVDLSIIERDSLKICGAKPFIFTHLKTGKGLAGVGEFVTGSVVERSGRR